jgi:predicted flap endonuclease-1-like 5' DNA nuclease
MATKIIEIEGIGPVYAEKLTAAGAATVESLLEKGSTRAGRKNLAEGSGIDEGKILDFVNMADLFRIKGVAGQFAEVLKAAGVDTVKELATRNPENLHVKLKEVNDTKNLANALPSLKQVEDYISQAKELPSVITY